MLRYALSGLVCLLLLTCQSPGNDHVLFTPSPEQESQESLPYTTQSFDRLYDKVLGALVGSAIGDAMGAPTEMWSREQIHLEYGWVDSLDDMVREPSAEGTWAFNLPAGGTTDDTRWKVLTADYYLAKPGEFYATTGPEPARFAQYIVDQYNSELRRMKQIESFDPAPLEAQMRRINWLQEWAQVAKPFGENDLRAYEKNLHRFYGGEMVCAGILYAPLLGIIYPDAPQNAYRTGYDLALFDLGYARDITGLTAALVAAAMADDATPSSILRTLRDIDPEHYFASRLVGRSSYRIYREALSIADGVAGLPAVDYQKQAFARLDELKQDFPFHAGEIHLINLTALMVSQWNFRDALSFVINYGRDNDTVGAVTGAILGAYYGYDKLPPDLTQTVLSTNKNRLGIDLEDLARQLTDTMMKVGVSKPHGTNTN